jgi:hypothetical protein
MAGTARSGRGRAAEHSDGGVSAVEAAGSHGIEYVGPRADVLKGDTGARLCIALPDGARRRSCPIVATDVREHRQPFVGAAPPSETVALARPAVVVALPHV